MSQDHILNFYLNPRMQRMATAGEGIYGKIAQAVQAAGWTLHLRERFEPVSGPGYHLRDNLAVSEPNSLVLRRSHLDPFYRIEATNDRWNWQIAGMDFFPRQGDEWFLKYWQKRIFADVPIASGGYVFMPLQGKLQERRHFQSHSPVEMIKATLKADPKRQIRATLHPNESYSPEDLAALTGFGPRFALLDEPSLPLLAGCDYVVTENSSLAFHGFFARKPAVLFAEIDFHHIAGSVPKQGLRAAFQLADIPRPFASYLHWFLRENAISAWADDCAGKGHRPPARPRLAHMKRHPEWGASRRASDPVRSRR